MRASFGHRVSSKSATIQRQLDEETKRINELAQRMRDEDAVDQRQREAQAAEWLRPAREAAGNKVG